MRISDTKAAQSALVYVCLTVYAAQQVFSLLRSSMGWSGEVGMNMNMTGFNVFFRNPG